MPDFYQNDNVKKGTGMQWRHQVVSDLPTMSVSVTVTDCVSHSHRVPITHTKWSKTKSKTKSDLSK